MQRTDAPISALLADTTDPSARLQPVVVRVVGDGELILPAGARTVSFNVFNIGDTNVPPTLNGLPLAESVAFASEYPGSNLRAFDLVTGDGDDVLVIGLRKPITPPVSGPTLDMEDGTPMTLENDVPMELE